MAIVLTLIFEIGDFLIMILWRLYQQRLEEAIEQAKIEARTEGIAEGIAEGRTEGEAAGIAKNYECVGSVE